MKVENLIALNFKNYEKELLDRHGDRIKIDSEKISIVFVPELRRSHSKCAYNGSRHPHLHKQVEFDGGDSCTLQYTVKLHDEFKFGNGTFCTGKLPSIGPVEFTTGGNAPPKDGWSVRPTWRENGKVELYVYQQERTDDGWGWRFPSTSQSCYPVNDEFRLGLYVKVNTTAHSNDGIAKLYINGKLVCMAEKLRLWSGEKSAGVRKLIVEAFYGGLNSERENWAPERETMATFSDFAVYCGEVVGD